MNGGRHLLGFASVCIMLWAGPATALGQMIALWPGETAPNGWYFCDGTELPKSEHPALFEAIGTAYGGSGDRFAIPNLGSADERSLNSNSKVRYIISDGTPGTTFTDAPAGLITLFAGTFEIRSYSFLEGQRVDPEEYALLTSIVYEQFGARLPDLRIRYELAGEEPNDARSGKRTVLGSRWPAPLIAMRGLGPESGEPDPSKLGSMDAYIAQVVLYAGSTPPRGWAACDGALLPIGQNDALFSLVGTLYGGDGRATFGVPNLTAKSKLLKEAAGLKEDAPQLMHIISIYGIYPSRL